MAVTNLMNENEEYIRSAVNDGISADAARSTLEDVINKSNELGKTPSQIKDVVDTIIDMKSDVRSELDNNYASNFVKENNTKIQSAINDGISPNEIATSLINSVNEVDSMKAKRNISFIVKLISKMKKKELKLVKTDEKGYQKVKN